MRRAAVLLISILFISITLIAQEEQVNQDEMMKIWMEYMTPSDVHKHFQKLEGTWTTDIKFWMAPGTEPTSSTGEAVGEMILGGRYLKFTHTGNYMNMPMEGMSLESYDNSKKELTSIWIDNMGTGMMVLKGAISDDFKTLEYSGTIFDPISKSDMKVRQVSKMLDDNKMQMEMFMTYMDQEFKNMEIIFTRK